MTAEEIKNAKERLKEYREEFDRYVEAYPDNHGSYYWHLAEAIDDIAGILIMEGVDIDEDE